MRGAVFISKNLTSVELYDSASGQWASLQDLQRGRRSHAMLIRNGRLTVTGGVQADGRLMRASEEFDRKWWIDSRSNLREPRQGFSLIKVLNLQFIKASSLSLLKVPASRFSKRRRPRSRALSNRNTHSEPKIFNPLNCSTVHYILLFVTKPFPGAGRRRERKQG